MRVVTTILFIILCLGGYSQSTFNNPYRGATHTYNVSVDDSNLSNPVKWYVATDISGTHAEYGSDFQFVTDGYDETEDALLGTAIYEVELTWGLEVQIETVFYIFVEVADNATGCTNKFALTVTVKDGNHAPIAESDQFNCFFNTTNQEIHPLDNDSDPDGDDFSLTEATYPTSGGSVSIENNTILYTPPTGYIGADTVIYTICDNGTPSLCDTDTILIDVEYCNDYTGISGVLTNADNGLALKNVPITLIPQGDTPGLIELMVTSASGYYEFDNLSPGSYLVQVQDENLNAARGLYSVESSLFFTDLVACEYQQHNFTYETYDGPVLSGIVWYDLNRNGIIDEWFDANDDNQITQNIPDANGFIDFDQWEWIDYNEDGSYEGLENLGELNVGGFGNVESPNVYIENNNGYKDSIIVGILGAWRSRPEGANSFGTYTVRLINDTYLQASAELIRQTELVKVIDDVSKSVFVKSVSRPQASTSFTNLRTGISELYCDQSVEMDYTVVVTEADPAHIELNFGYYCNNSPVAVTDYINSIINAIDKEIEVLNNDSDPDGDEITLTEVTQPTSGGTASIVDNKLIYTPPHNYSGMDTVLYTVCDNGLSSLCTQDTVFIMVADGNPPVAVNDTLNVYGGIYNIFTVTNNDYDLDDNLDETTVRLNSYPQHGEISVDPETGKITYRPYECYIGFDEFTYIVFDEKNLVSNIATVTLEITISPTYDADADNVPDIVEDLNGDGDPCNDDFDGDGIPDYHDVDDDNDGVLTILEDFESPDDPTQTNTDGDEFPNYHDIDDDNDCVLTIAEDTNGDGNYLNDDLDNDGIPNFIDDDDDNDGRISCDELADLDGNGVPDYQEDWNSKAIDDYFNIDMNAPLQLEIMYNDTSRMRPPTLTILDMPQHGTLEVTFDSLYDSDSNRTLQQRAKAKQLQEWGYTITYFPELNFAGVDTFTYEVCDHYEDCDSATVYIFIDDIIMIPEIFTPNGDGENDVLTIEGLERHAGNELYIHNRWGSLVYYTKDYQNNWDGTSNTGVFIGNNRQLPVGTYYYILKIFDVDKNSGIKTERERQGGIFIER